MKYMLDFMKEYREFMRYIEMDFAITLDKEMGYYSKPFLFLSLSFLQSVFYISDQDIKYDYPQLRDLIFHLFKETYVETL